MQLQNEDEQRRAMQAFPDLSDEEVYGFHCRFLVRVANEILGLQSRKFVIDDNNRDILRFLLLYFNECPLAEEVFPGRGYKLHKNLILMGAVGVGKTLLMQIFPSISGAWAILATSSVYRSHRLSTITSCTTTWIYTPTTKKICAASKSTLTISASTILVWTMPRSMELTPSR